MYDFFQLAYYDETDGVYRWRSNNLIPYKTILSLNKIPKIVIRRCCIQREAELEWHLEREANKAVVIDFFTRKKIC